MSADGCGAPRSEGDTSDGCAFFLKVLYTHLFQCRNGGATQIVQRTDRHHYGIIHITGKLCKGKQGRTKTPHLFLSGLDCERPIVRRNNNVVAFCRRCVPLIVHKRKTQLFSKSHTENGAKRDAVTGVGIIGVPCRIHEFCIINLEYTVMNVHFSPNWK